jgi:hypothetical protein
VQVTLLAAMAHRLDRRGITDELGDVPHAVDALSR